MATLTDRRILALKASPGRRREYPDAAVPGLALRVSGPGAKSWALRYRVGGRQRRLTLGSYPPMSLAKARKAARNAILAVQATGADPAEAKRQGRLGDTFADLADVYMQVAEKQKRSWREDERTINVELLPHWKHRKLREITRRDVRTLIEAIVARPAPVMGNRVWALVSRIFNFAIEQDMLDTGNPATRLKKQPERSRDRVLNDDEIRALWTALDTVMDPPRVDDADATPPAIAPMIARGLQVLLLTAQRPGEVFQMRWQDVDLDGGWWTIPAEHSKNGEPHRVPLTTRIVDLLKDAKAAAPADNPWVFAGHAGANVASRAKKAMAALRAAEAIGFEVHRHDLRRTAATNIAAAGISRETISHLLNHVDRGSRATAIYDRYSHDAEKRTALEAWARRLDAIVTGKTEARVVPFNADAGAPSHARGSRR